MAEQIVLTDLVNLQNETTAVNAINSNNATIEDAFLDVLSLSGTAPNQMQSPLDMNSNRVVNLPAPVGSSEPVRLQDLASVSAGGTFTPLPTGGTTGQVLTKNTSTNYDVSWVAAAGLTAGSNITLTGSAPTTIALTASPTFAATNLTGTAASLTSGNVTTNANLTGPITSTGNATAVAAQTGTGSTFVMNTSPTLVTPVLGVATATSINGQTLANSPAFTIRGNATGSTAADTDISIPALTNKASPVAGDIVLIADSAASNALKYATVGSIATAGSVTSIAGNTGAFTLTKGITNSTNAIGLSLSNATLQTTTLNPTGTASNVNVMMGLGSTCTLTPVYSTRVRVEFNGAWTNNTANAGTFAQINYGTGTAPTNGAAQTGTLIGSVAGYNPTTATNKASFSLSALITGLTVGTAYWFDLAVFIGAGTGTLTSVTCNAMEF